MMNGRPLGVWSLEFDFFSVITHNGFCQSLAVILVPRTGLAWRHPRPNKSVIERRALQSITCDVRTSRRPVLHNNIFHYSTPL
jgi:hypothetical protein